MEFLSLKQKHGQELLKVIMTITNGKTYLVGATSFIVEKIHLNRTEAT